MRSVIPEGVDKGALEWIITPNLIPGWIRNPVIGISQVGYHPAQVKQAVIELDASSDRMSAAILKKIGNDGTINEIKSGVPETWGKFLRYKYVIFDFPELKEPYPFFAQQAEYVMPGAASYIFCILAADKMLNE